MKTPSLLLLLSLIGVAGRQETMDNAQTGVFSPEDARQLLRHPDAFKPLILEMPLGLPQDVTPFLPDDNAMFRAKVDLGRMLYFDKRLSRDGTISCATCHDPVKGWTDNEPVSTGIDGQKGGRSAPTVLNRVFGKSQFWDGRAASLEEQAVGPIGNPIEMGFTVEEAAELLNGIPAYRILFSGVFDGAATPERIGQAIAAFERTIVSGASKNDYYEQALPWFDWDAEEEDDAEVIARGNKILDLEKQNRMSPEAERGRELFFDKAKCSTCHVGADLTDEDFHNLGIGMDLPKPDMGRHDHTGRDEDRGAFRTPTLRNIVETAPYMHDGSLATLMEVVEHYDKGGTPNEWLSDKIFPLNLTEQERKDLVTFMEEALTGATTQVEVPRLP